MKTKILLLAIISFFGITSVYAQDHTFTTTGSCAPYIKVNEYWAHDADSIYKINKASADDFEIDALANEEDWSTRAFPMVLNKIAHEKSVDDEGNPQELDLSIYPQTEKDLKATFKALWVEWGVYMFIHVEDDLVRYQNPGAQWENDGIEMYFAKAVGEGKRQLIIPAMVGTPAPGNPAAKDLETGSATGSDPSYAVFGYDNDNWDESLFSWAIRKTDKGYDMEVFLDRDIITNNNSSTNFGLNKMFAGDINVDEADELQNENDPALYIREGTLAMLGYSNQEYASSNYYGYFELVDEAGTTDAPDFKNATSFAYCKNKQLVLKNVAENSNVRLYSTTGKIAMEAVNTDAAIDVSTLQSGLYIVTVDNKSVSRIMVK